MPLKLNKEITAMSTNNTELTILSTSIRQDAEGRYSLSDCWKASGKDKKNQPSKWFEAEKTQEFLRVLGGDPENRATPVSLVTTGPNEGRGYWADRKAVIHYATWISADFYLTVISAFDALITGQIPNAAPKAKQFDRITLLRKAIALHGSTLAYHKRQGMDLTQARLKANATVLDQMGIDLPKELGWQPQPLAVQERTMNATQIGAELGIKNTQVNQLLADQGYHTGLRDAKQRRVWKPTNKGMPFGRYEDKAKAHSAGTVQPWVWYPSIVEELRPFVPTPA